MYVVQKKVHIAGIWRALPLTQKACVMWGFFFPIETEREDA